MAEIPLEEEVLMLRERSEQLANACREWSSQYNELMTAFEEAENQLGAEKAQTQKLRAEIEKMQQELVSVSASAAAAAAAAAAASASATPQIEPQPQPQTPALPAAAAPIASASDNALQLQLSQMTEQLQQLQLALKAEAQSNHLLEHEVQIQRQARAELEKRLNSTQAELDSAMQALKSQLEDQSSFRQQVMAEVEKIKQDAQNNQNGDRSSGSSSSSAAASAVESPEEYIGTISSLRLHVLDNEKQISEASKRIQWLETVRQQSERRISDLNSKLTEKEELNAQQKQRIEQLETEVNAVNEEWREQYNKLSQSQQRSPPPSRLLMNPSSASNNRPSSSASSSSSNVAQIQQLSRLELHKNPMHDIVDNLLLTPLHASTPSPSPSPLPSSSSSSSAFSFSAAASIPGPSAPFLVSASSSLLQSHSSPIIGLSSMTLSPASLGLSSPNSSSAYVSSPSKLANIAPEPHPLRKDRAVTEKSIYMRELSTMLPPSLSSSIAADSDLSCTASLSDSGSKQYLRPLPASPASRSNSSFSASGSLYPSSPSPLGSSPSPLGSSLGRRSVTFSRSLQ